MSLIADVFDVLLVDESTDETIATGTLQDAGIEVSVDENEVRGGQGNQLLGVLHSARDVAINLTDATFRYDWIAKALGQDVTTGAGIAYAKPKWYVTEDDTTTTGTEVQITLDKTPNSTDHGISAYNASGQQITGFTVSGNIVDFAGASPTVAVGDSVEIRTFRYDTSASTETIKFDTKTFASGVKCILETVEIDGDEAITHTLQYQFDKSVPNGSFSISTASERSASTQDFNLRVIKPDNTTEIGRVLRIPVA